MTLEFDVCGKEGCRFRQLDPQTRIARSVAEAGP
jgi:hypothetical protein